MAQGKGVGAAKRRAVGFVFRVADGRRYNPVLNSCLKNLLAGLGR